MYGPRFVILPDCVAAANFAARSCASASHVITHPSGQPWIVGWWKPGDVNTVSDGQGSLAIIGWHDASDDLLWKLLRRLSSPIGFGGIVNELRGSHYLITSHAGHISAKGTLSGFRRLFYTTLSEIAIASNQARLLSSHAKAALDTCSLATRLVYPAAPHSIESLPLWVGIKPLPENAWLRISSRTATEHLWWHPPEARLSVADVAPTLRSELSRGVNSCARTRATLSADLSGGLDSTPICFLAKQTGARLITLTSDAADGTNQDLHWAGLASAHLQAFACEVIPPHALPAPYKHLTDGEKLDLDEPFVGIPVWQRIAQTAMHVRALGSEVHLTGHGGDEVLIPSTAFIFEAMRRRAVSSILLMREIQAQKRWTLRSIASRLLDNRPYNRWLLDASISLLDPPPKRGQPLSIWGGAEFRLPAWISSDAATAVRDLLSSQASSAKPLDGTRSGHASLEMIRTSGRSNRLVAQIMSSHGVSMAAPYLDDHVVACCLSVRPEEKMSRYQYKPLIAEAMRTVVPAPLLKRRDKPDFTADVHRGRRAHVRELVQICEDLRLAKLGLIEPDIFRDACLGLRPDIPHIAIWRTLSCEMWLRSISSNNRLLRA